MRREAFHIRKRIRGKVLHRRNFPREITQAKCKANSRRGFFVVAISAEEISRVLSTVIHVKLLVTDKEGVAPRRAFFVREK